MSPPIRFGGAVSGAAVGGSGVTPTIKHHGSRSRREGSAPAAPRCGAGRGGRAKRCAIAALSPSPDPTAFYGATARDARAMVRVRRCDPAAAAIAHTAVRSHTPKVLPLPVRRRMRPHSTRWPGGPQPHASALGAPACGTATSGGASWAQRTADSLAFRMVMRGSGFGSGTGRPCASSRSTCSFMPHFAV